MRDSGTVEFWKIQAIKQKYEETNKIILKVFEFVKHGISLLEYFIIRCILYFYCIYLFIYCYLYKHLLQY